MIVSGDGLRRRGGFGTPPAFPELSPSPPSSRGIGRVSSASFSVVELLTPDILPRHANFGRDASVRGMSPTASSYTGRVTAGPGWYPDPGGQPSMFRYWDGRAWSAALSPHPSAPPPGSGGLGPPPPPTQPVPVATRPRGKRPWGWLIGLGAVLVALIIVVVLVVQRIGGEEPITADPGGQPSTEVCPEPETATAEPQPGDGRVHAGKLSYPELGSPWSAPEPEDGVAFGKGVLIQSVEIERSPANQRWLAAVLVGELVAGDGFFSPKDGAAIVVKCVMRHVLRRLGGHPRRQAE